MKVFIVVLLSIIMFNSNLLSIEHGHKASIIVDLDKVLDVLQNVLSNEKPTSKNNKTNRFLNDYAFELNRLKVTNKTVGVELGSDGAIYGYIDPNKNNKKDKGEKLIFKVEADNKHKRFIATSL